MAQIRGKQIGDGEITAAKLAASTVTAAQVDTTNGAISTVNAGDAAAEGAGTGLARRDHQHAVATAAPGTIAVGDAAAGGASSSLARADHTHALPAPAAPADVTKAAASAGVATTVARADHKHDVATAAAVELTDSTNAEGASTSLARADHTHGHGNRGGGSLHALASGGAAGFMSAADKTKLDALQEAAAIDAKEACRVRAQGNLTLSGTQTIDGVSCGVGDRVLADQQTTTTEDGIYVVAAGAWSRAADMPAASEAAGVRVWIKEGTTDGDRLYACSNDQGSDIVGTDDLTFGLIGAGSPRGAGAGLVLNGNDIDAVANADGSIVVNANDIQVGVINATQHGNLAGGSTHAAAVASGASGFMTGTDKAKLDGVATGAEVNDTPNQEAVTTQNITGTDTALTDTLNNSPVSAASVALYLNGLLQRQGAGQDYTISGQTITWLASTGTAVDMDTSDELVAVYLS